MHRVVARLPRFWRPASGLDDRGALLKRMPKGARCAELGVWKGQFSTRILEITKPRLLHLVDPWLYQPRFPYRHYGGKTARNQEDMDAIYNEVVDKFMNSSNVKVHRATSKAFFAHIRARLDWVYIDGDHSTEAVLEDLTLAWQRVEDLSVVAGDDYYWKDFDGTLPVKIAVDKFCEQHGCSKELIGGQFLLRKG